MCPLQCVAARCSVLQCVAVCCSVLEIRKENECVSVAVCCSVSQCVAVCCSVLQCVDVQEGSRGRTAKQKHKNEQRKSVCGRRYETSVWKYMGRSRVCGK